jgi:hypothetical protein
MRSFWLPLFVSVSALGAAACSGDRPTTPTGTTAAERVSTSGSPNAPAADGDCHFSRGVTTCTTSAQHVETGTHAEVSGCMAFNGTAFVAGRRTRTFDDQVLVTELTTTLRHGRHGPVYDTSTSTTRAMVASTLVSDQCVAL